MSNAADKIRKLSQKAANSKLAKQRKEIEEKIANDIQVVEDILKLVKDRLIYKDISDKYGREKYIVVTEDIVLEDYSNPAKYNNGTSISFDSGGYYSYPHTVITVSGHTYSHAGDILTRYQHQAKTAVSRSEKEVEIAREKKKALDDLMKLEPVIKTIMLNYQTYLDNIKPKSV